MENKSISKEITVKEPRHQRLLELRSEIPARVYWGAGATFFALILILWLLLTSLGLIPTLFLPGPQAVWQELLRQIKEGILLQDASASLYRIMLGWIISTLFAVPIGIMMGNFKLFEGMLEPFIDLMRYMPAVAFVPLTILWVGVGDSQKILILFIGTFFQEVLMIMDNVKGVPRELIEVSATFGLSRFEILRDVILRYAMPGIWDTFRITLGWAWTYLVVAELVAANVGLGYRIMRAQRFLQTETIILGIIIIGLMGLVTDMLFKLAYHRMFRWMDRKG